MSDVATPPRVSIVVVTFNRGRLLEATLSALRYQTFRDFECIVADDCSTDDTEARVHAACSSDARFRYRQNCENVGMPENLNRALRECKGEYIAVLHDDDLYDAQLVEKWVRVLDTHPSAGFVFNSYAVLDGEDRVVRSITEPLQELTSGHRFIEETVLSRPRMDCPVWGTAMVRRTSLDDVGLLEERFGFYADVDLWLRLAAKYDVGYVASPLVALRSQLVAPHMFDDGLATVRPIVEKIFWEARVRHFTDRPLRLQTEKLRHLSYVAITRLWLWLLQARKVVSCSGRRMVCQARATPVIENSRVRDTMQEQ
jgi:glycosyltransferase involved in cell wall biosynthesis